MLNSSEASERLIEPWNESKAPRIRYHSSSGVFQRGFEVVKRTSGSYTGKYRNCEGGRTLVTLNRAVSCDNSVQRNLFPPQGVTQPFFRKYIPCKTEESNCDRRPVSENRTHLQDGLDLQYQLNNVAGQMKGNLQQTPAMSLPSQINNLPDYSSEYRESITQQILLNNEKTECGPRKQSKLKRRKAYYKQKKEQGRSRSLTHIDALDATNNTMVNSDPNFAAEIKSVEELPKESYEGTVTILIEGINSSGDAIEEDIPVSRGGSLRDSISYLCEQYHIDLSMVALQLAESNSVLDQSLDLAHFAKKKIIIRVRDSLSLGKGPIKSPSIKKVSSGSYRAKTNRFFHVSSEEQYPSGIESPAGSADGSLKLNKMVSKQSNRWSGFFSSSFKDKDKMDILTERLNQYSRYGIPSLPQLQHEHTNVELQEILWLESDWKVIVDHDEMNDKIHQQQSAIWELVQTEATYINTIRVVTDLFLKCLASLHNDQSLVEIDIDMLFSNIQEIYEANLNFWIDHILPMLTESRKTKCPFDPTKMSTGFLRFRDVFQPYMKYCLDQSRCQLYCKEKDQDNGCFKTYLAWCETQKDCQRLRLVDILVKPMQRLTKYSLLLKAILKKTSSEVHCHQVENMIECVKDFVKSVNTALRKRHDQQKLHDIVTRIESYDVIETKDEELDKLIRGFTEFDLTVPIPDCPVSELRCLLKEGDFKLKEHGNSKDIHCFLFTDLLLLCKSVGKKSEARVKIIRQPYRLDRLIFGELRDPCSLNVVYLNDYRTVSAAFTLSHSDSRVIKTWHDQLKRAQEQLVELKRNKPPIYLGLSVEEESENDPLGSSYCRSYKSSTKASQMSSLVHSHSGSMEITDNTQFSNCECSSLHITGNTLADLRSHSHSTDEGLDIRYRSGSSARDITSPRLARRCCVCQQRDKNSLCVEASCSGQSLPNLNVESSNNSLTVPSNRLLSATQRGISYPPPSPRSLQRSSPVPQSRNPPLVKSRPINDSPGYGESSSFEIDASVSSGIDCDGDYFEETYAKPGSALGLKRTIRPERLDNRRYHTAGAIEDLKRQDNRDPSIYKRLSLNYGQHLQQSQPLASHLSSDSVQSSSGVSSVGSVHLSLASELTGEEDLFEEDVELIKRPDASQVKIDISEMKDGGGNIKISMSNSREAQKLGIISSSLRDLILNDSNMEASEV